MIYKRHFSIAAILALYAGVPAVAQDDGSQRWSPSELRERSYVALPNEILICLDVAKPKSLDWSEIPSFFTREIDAEQVAPGQSLVRAYAVGRPSTGLSGEDFNISGVIYQRPRSNVCAGQIRNYVPDKFSNPNLEYGDYGSDDFRENGMPHFSRLQFLEFHFDKQSGLIEEGAQRHVFKTRDGEHYVIVSLGSKALETWHEDPRRGVPIQFFVASTESLSIR